MKKILFILVMIVMSLQVNSQVPELGIISYKNKYFTEKNFYFKIQDLILRNENFAYCQEDFLGDKECNTASIIGTYRINQIIDTSVNDITYHIFVLSNIKDNRIIYYDYITNTSNRFELYNEYIRDKYFPPVTVAPDYQSKPEIILTTTTSYVGNDIYKIVTSQNKSCNKYFSRTYKNGKLISETITQY